VLNHRIILNYKARLDSVTGFAVVRELLAKVEATGLALPRDMAVAAAER
jgi:MoxR-like ATPase